MSFDRMPERLLRQYAVSIPTTNSLALNESFFFQFMNDSLHSAFGDSHANRNFAQHHFWFCMKQYQYM